MTILIILLALLTWRYWLPAAGWLFSAYLLLVVAALLVGSGIDILQRLIG